MNEEGPSVILRMSEVTRTFGAVKAVDRLSLDLYSGEFLTLLGPSGCGKTTALRLIAGFDAPDSGKIWYHGRDVTARSPQQRAFGMVFQNYALFPHLDVFENVAFGLRARRMDPTTIRSKVEVALDIVNLTGYGQRAVQALSGGQQQRVALARALAIEPSLLLLDEPLSNLDQTLRLQTRNELRRLVGELGITALFVTHDQEEAFDLSDRIAVMNTGRIRQIGSPRELYEEPAERFVAEFVGRANWLPVSVGPDGIRVATNAIWPGPGAQRGGVIVRAPNGLTDPTARLVFRPDALEFSTDDTDGDRLPPIQGVVRDRRFRGSTVRYHIEVGILNSIANGDTMRQPHEGSLEIDGPPDGPAIGATTFLRPALGARLHLFPPTVEGPGLPDSLPREIRG